jgi:pSer/pThr/pTyr-binding forkhead associated (FHA) protein
MPEPTQPDKQNKQDKPVESESKIVEPPLDPSSDTQRLRPLSRDEASAALAQATLSERIKKLMEKAGSAPSSSAPTESLSRTQPLKREETSPSASKTETSLPATSAQASKPPAAQTAPASAPKPPQAAPPAPAPKLAQPASAPAPVAKPAMPASPPPPASAEKGAETAQQAGAARADKQQDVKPRPASATAAPNIQPWRVIFQTVANEPKAIGAEIHRATVIGRADPRSNLKPDIDLAPHDAQACGVSRQHALLLPSDTGLSLIDLDSTNGTWINGLYLQPGLRYNLRSGDRIELGTLKLIVRVVGPVSEREIGKEVTAVSRNKPKRM